MICKEFYGSYSRSRNKHLEDLLCPKVICFDEVHPNDGGKKVKWKRHVTII